MKNPIADKILFLRVKNKDHEAYGRFYDLYVERIYRFVYFKVSSVDDAKDLTSEVFLKLWQYIKDGKPIHNLNALTYMIARNCVIDFYRARARRDENEEKVADEHITIIDDEGDILIQKIKDAEMAEVLATLKKLKDEYREVIVLRYLDELSIKEISKILDKSPGSVRVLLYRALNAIKTTIKQ
jgi:RNA polymerase sigma-70 factor (ECF subfamily)